MSGSGKTTIARGLMALLVRQGMTVQPFKCGPDYIDTKFHEAVCGRPSVNLDTFMASPEHVRELFVHYGSDADVSLRAGYDVRHALIGPGVRETHGYERTHEDALKATLELISAIVEA